MQPDLIPTLTQFGVAGLVAAMWLVERRAASTREKQLAEAHDRLVESRAHLDVLLTVVKDNTRAITALEAAVSRLMPPGPAAPAATPSHALTGPTRAA